MTEYISQTVDIAVIGAGHAGIEAALAAARMGRKTVLFTINLDSSPQYARNPLSADRAKAHLVYEIDALGGEMGRVADKVWHAEPHFKPRQRPGGCIRSACRRTEQNTAF